MGLARVSKEIQRDLSSTGDPPPMQLYFSELCPIRAETEEHTSSLAPRRAQARPSAGGGVGFLKVRWSQIQGGHGGHSR